MIKIKSVLVFIIFMLYSFNCFAVEKDKIKFHPPETEAEKALDNILSASSGLIKNNFVIIDSIIHNELLEGKELDVYSKDLHTAIIKWRDKIYASGECQTNDLCFGESDQLTCAQDDLTDIGFLYYSIVKDNIIYIYMKSKGFKYQYLQSNDIINKLNKLEFEKNDPSLREFHNYAMKKEDDIWKIDGICCRSSRFNHKYCGFDGYKTSIALTR